MNTLADVRVKFDLISSTSPIVFLKPEEAVVFLRLVAASASSYLGVYAQKTDGWVALDDRIHRWAGLSARRFKKVWKEISHLFEERDGLIRPIDEWFTLPLGRGEARPPIPASIRSFVMQRDAFRCVYCGSEQGPFDIDHVIPYSRGGSHTDPENLVCACARCNRVKKAKTPEEWMADGVPFE